MRQDRENNVYDALCPEYRYLRQRQHTRYARRASSQRAPPRIMWKHRTANHVYDKTVVDTVTHYYIHSVEVYLAAKQLTQPGSR